MARAWSEGVKCRAINSISKGDNLRHSLKIYMMILALCLLAAQEHKTVEVFDLRTGARTHSIEGFGHPLMMVYLPEFNQLVVTDGDNSAVQLVDCTHYKIIKTIKLSPDVD